jgi:hypothetical protein
MDLIRDHQDERSRRAAQCLLDRRGIEEADRDVDGLAVGAPLIQVDLARVHHRTQPDAQGRLRHLRVVFLNQGGEHRDKPVKQHGLRHLVMRPDKHEDAIAAVGQLLKSIVGYRSRRE